MAKQTRIAEHKKAVVSFDQNTNVSSDVHHSSHNMDFENVKVVGFEASYHERLFSKLGTPLWTQMPETTIQHTQKPTKTSREHKHLTWSRAQASRYVNFKKRMTTNFVFNFSLMKA